MSCGNILPKTKPCCEPAIKQVKYIGITDCKSNKKLLIFIVSLGFTLQFIQEYEAYFLDENTLNYSINKFKKL